VLFKQRFWSGITDGSITRTYRRWKRPQVVAGGTYRTPAGRIDVESIAEVDPASITDADAQRSGYTSAAELVSELRGDATMPVYCIVFRGASDPDPRAELAADDTLTHEDLVDIDHRLARLDRASTHGPWTGDVLDAIAERPHVRAADLAAALGRETQPFKVDVRKLKALGLTLSFDVGYELSPRGKAYRAARRPPARRR
jgi:hypothetical protein